MAHLLRRLELNGFKSFAQKTVLEFPAGITAIVGPNGSGKSNVIDAIRWLLGEREAKNLRGGKGEDLIFAGTAKRSRMGQAQAGLFFENHGKFFPVEFGEVSIVRQVNRDGTNQYFLNKSEVRLKDIVDFFAKARLGTKGLVVVTQGNSDLFISSSPSIRREMIEEMLGLREYQLKKSEAERRLKHAEINLEKVRALTEEILPHLRSLKRQTNRWEKREAMAGELKELENDFFGFQVGRIKKEEEEIGRHIASHGHILGTLKKEKAEAEMRLKAVEATQPKEREELSKIRALIRELSEERTTIQKEVGRLEARVEVGVPSKKASLSSDKLLALLHGIKERLENSLEEDFMELRESIADLVREIEEALDELPRETPQNSKGGLEGELKKIVVQVEKLGKDLDALHEKENTLEKNQEAFYRTFKDAVQAVQVVNDKIEKWDHENQERLFARERCALRLEEIKKQVHQSGRSFAEFVNMRGVGEKTEANLLEIERRMFKLRGDLASMGEIDEALLKEVKETQERYEFLERESRDLEKATTDLRKLIADLSDKVATEFKNALEKINEEFNNFFRVMFGGGHASLKIEKPPKKEKVQGVAQEATSDMPSVAVLTMPEEEVRDTESGIQIGVSLPRKKINTLEMLSGGERSLVGIAALFAMISVSPPPFLVLDEIDAALDERNARRFAEMLKTFSHRTQFIVVTHNRATMEAAHVLYGVTMNEDGTSKILSLKLQQ